MDTLKKIKLKASELVDKERKSFYSTCNISVKLLKAHRTIERAKRSDDGTQYLFYEKVSLMINEIFVDENNRLLVIKEISNVIVSEDNSYKYKVATVEEYKNPAGIISLVNKQEIKNSGNVNLIAARDVILNNSTVANTGNIILSLLENIDLPSAWESVKKDLYDQYDYEKYQDIVRDVDNYFDGDAASESKFKKHIAKAREIAGVLGTFVGAILYEIIKNITKWLYSRLTIL